MTDEDGFRIEAAEQFGFEFDEGDLRGERYICTEAQLIAFAKACERAGMAKTVEVFDRLYNFATSELRNTSQLMSYPTKSAAAWDIRNAVSKEKDALTAVIARIDAELAPILAAANQPAPCDSCDVNRADPPSKLCPGCQAYREHQS